MKAKIVLARPVYEENIGLVARAMANFGFKEMALVKPECNWKSGKAKSRAMKGKRILERAKTFNSIKEATGDCSCAVATTAKKGAKRNAVSAEELAKRLGKSTGKAAIVLGPEPSGLTNSEIAECDFIASIPASKEYPTLNLSHAACIILYSLYSQKRGKPFKEASPATKRLMLQKFEESLGLVRSIDDKKAVKSAFRALCSRTLISEKEARAMAALFSETRKGLERAKD